MLLASELPRLQGLIASELPHQQDVSTMQDKPFPMSYHPLTLALIAGARAHTHEAMRQASLLSRQMAHGLTPTEIEQCKLAAEVMIERNL